MDELHDTNGIFDWVANGGRFRVVRDMKTNGGHVFAAGETVRLVRLEPSLVDHSYVAVCESDLAAGKLIRIRETMFDAVEPF